MEEELQQEVYRGHLDECVKHFFRRLVATAPKFSRNTNKAKKNVARFCGVGAPAIQRWITGKNRPTGESLVKLMFYLDMSGYRVIELERMDPVLRNFTELISYGVMSSADASNLLGFTEIAKLYRIIRGRAGFSKEKTILMYQAWKQRKGELEQKKVAAKQRYSVQIPSGAGEKVKSKPKKNAHRSS